MATVKTPVEKIKLGDNVCTPGDHIARKGEKLGVRGERAKPKRR